MYRKVISCFLLPFVLAALVVAESKPPTEAGEPAPTARESILDRVIHLETVLHTEIPPAPRWCDRLGMKSRRIDVGDAELHVEVEGEGPAIVLINGGPGGTHHYFHPWFSRVAEYAHVIYYDQRGCGLSDYEPGDGYTVEQAVGDLDQLRRSLGIEKWTLLGYSYGGFLAQLYTIRHPENVSGLILLGAEPGMWTDFGESRQERFLSQEEKDRKEEILAELRTMRDEKGWTRDQMLALAIYNFWLNGDWKRQHFFRPNSERMTQIALYEWVQDRDFNSIMGRTRDRIDLSGAFAANPIPTLILEGEFDMTWGEKKPEMLAGNHPKARFVSFENAAHGVYDEQPDQFFAALEEFLGSLAEVPPAAVAQYKEELERWQTAQQARPLYKLRSAGWGRASSGRLAESYDRSWLQQFPEPRNLIRIGFALYDVEDYEEALVVFESMERSAAADGDRGYEAVALIWQGHMLDLLGRRPEAIGRYEQAAALGVEDQWHHSSYGMGYRPVDYAAERQATPFVRLENKDSS